MNRIEKNRLYRHFKTEWSKELDDLKFILQYLDNYSNKSDLFRKMSPLLKSDRLDISQMEWISLVDQLKHPQ
jgi:hypothetical protein